MASALGLLLHLAGPLQSWGAHSHFNRRDTAPHPTRSGIVGLLAAALGRGRHESLDDLATLRLTVRTDRAGVLLRDFHTVGGGLPMKETVVNAGGKPRLKHGTGTLVSDRYYLADAAFTAALTPAASTPADLLAECARALSAPRWPLYLGRRSCPPTDPVLIGLYPDPLKHLIHLPLAAPPPPESGDGHVELISDEPLDQLPLSADLAPSDAALSAQVTGQLSDQPVSFSPSSRTYRSRSVYRRTYTPPRPQWAGYGIAYLHSLTAYRSRNASQGALS
ncbi:type I-E CRISPR-associated protein Cas5/CasD [Streptomyces sp. P38-E01]|uniref:Type I-E CRISPR-associated protein Cas5/CasD n=1 Tax=Streptomyces tardus TaxID=2780544 RepID=A0A949JMJ3_9ACTN|nr:type I-E CRISPR-associated protein Cas5/CasD [Streptomyces tardus]